MNKLFEYFKNGSVTLKKVHSPINGELIVKWDITYGYQIFGGGLWQVGGPVESVWRKGIGSLPDDFTPKKILILGLGGGTIAKITRNKYPKSEITGVDIDPVIVGLGEDFLGLSKLKIKKIIENAFVVVEKFIRVNNRFDLVCVDLYVGENYPERFETEKFIKNISKLSTKSGWVCVNRLYYGKHRSLVEKFEKNLFKNFKKVKMLTYNIEENVMFLCSNEKGENISS